MKASLRAERRLVAFLELGLDSLKEFSLFVLVSWVGSISHVLGVMSLFWCWLGSLILGLAFLFISEALFVWVGLFIFDYVIYLRVRLI